jgi:hypothetical protein
VNHTSSVGRMGDLPQADCDRTSPYSPQPQSFPPLHANGIWWRNRLTRQGCLVRCTNPALAHPAQPTSHRCTAAVLYSPRRGSMRAHSKEKRNAVQPSALANPRSSLYLQVTHLQVMCLT